MPVNVQDLFKIYMSICRFKYHLVSGYISELSIFTFFSYHWQSSSTRAWYRYVSRAPGVAVRLWSWSVLSTLVVRHSHVTIPFIRDGMVNHQQGPATKHWFRKCILYMWMRTNMCICVYVCVYIYIYVRLLWNFLIIQFFGPKTAKRWASA